MAIIAARLGNNGRMISFNVGEKCIRFLGPKCLKKIKAVKKWNAGYIEIMADYGNRIEEDYIDLVPIFDNLMIDKNLLNTIEKVEMINA